MRRNRHFAVCALGAWAALGGVGVAQYEISAQGAGGGSDDAATRAAAIAAAVEDVTAEEPKGFWEQDYLTGEWGGLRKEWRDAGVDLSFLLFVDLGKNLTGGVEPGGDEMLTVFDAIAAFDLDKLFGWSGAKLVADFQLIRGDGPEHDGRGDRRRRRARLGAAHPARAALPRSELRGRAVQSPHRQVRRQLRLRLPGDGGAVRQFWDRCEPDPAQYADVPEPVVRRRGVFPTGQLASKGGGHGRGLCRGGEHRPPRAEDAVRSAR